MEKRGDLFGTLVRHRRDLLRVWEQRGTVWSQKRYLRFGVLCIESCIAGLLNEPVYFLR